MTRNQNILFLYQILVASWMMSCLSLSFVLAWALFDLQETKAIRRPGINLKAL